VTTNAIQAVGKRLAALCLDFTRPHRIPEHILAAHPVQPWLIVSLATVYLSFAKHWLAALLPAPEVWMAVGRHMDDCFFDLVSQTSLDVRISEVILDPVERAAVCLRAPIPAEEFQKTVIPIETVLVLVFADRCNQYTEDLREGIIRQLEGKKSVLGPVIFVYKRFNQHVYGVQCDARSISVAERFQFLVEFDHMFMDALTAITECVSKSGRELPFSL